MPAYYKAMLLTLSCVFYGLLGYTQTPPTQAIVSIKESVGQGCHSTTNHAQGRMCFDVSVQIDASGWNLYQYDIWMDYGNDNSILTHFSDLSCYPNFATPDNLDQVGKYRMGVDNIYAMVILPANQSVNIHNFCFEIDSFPGLDALEVIPGGQFFFLPSRLYLESGATQVSIDIPTGTPFDMSESSFLVIDPIGATQCQGSNLILSSAAVDATDTAIVDCEPFLYMWTGPDGYSSTQQNDTISITDTTAQSGLYELAVQGQHGCYGYQSFMVDLTGCQIACQDTQTVQGPIILTESLQANNEIIAQGGVVIEGNVVFSAPIIQLNGAFDVSLGHEFFTSSAGCP